LTAREDIVPREQCKLILRQFSALIADSIKRPDANPSDFSRIQKDLLAITPAKEIAIKSSVSLLHEFVENQAISIPDTVALEFATSLHNENVNIKRWTYHELNAEGNIVAKYLISQGLRPGQHVCVCFDKCAEASFAILGILKAGSAFIAIDPGAPQERKSFIVKDSEAKFILTASQLKDSFGKNLAIPIITLDEGLFRKNPPSTTTPLRLSRKIRPEDGCYCLYTSGTTGTPKGCRISHENAVQAMLSFQRLFKDHWDADSRFLQFASFHFDVSVLEQYWSWSVGICMSSAPRDLILEDIANTIRQLRITHIDLTPSLATTLSPEDVPSLCRGVFITGGEQLKQEILDIWGPKRCIYNGYGPTEATIGVTMYTRVPNEGRPSNIGRQFDNVGSYVMKSNTEEPTLRGAVGELCVSGKLVGLGYLNRPKLNDEKFPSLKASGEKIYRTGDLVRVLHDGCFEFLGRADDQVKLRGQRLETSEINEIIKSGARGIEEAITLVIKHKSQAKEQLVAFLVMANLKSPTEKLEIIKGKETKDAISAARNVCQARLPGYMIPTHFVPLNRIPLSTNNKADLKQIKSLYNELSTSELQLLGDTDFASKKEMTETERGISAILAKATGLPMEAIQPTTNIFRSGLDSINMVTYAHMLKDAGYRKAVISVVMQSKSRIASNHPAFLILSDPTIKSLATALTGEGKEPFLASTNPATISAQQDIKAFAHRHLPLILNLTNIKRECIEAISPCTPLQQGIISRSLGSNVPLYFNTFVFDLAGNMDIEKLRSVWVTLVKHNQVLRSQFIPTPDGYAQVVQKEMDINWQEMNCQDKDLEGLLISNRSTWWQRNRDIMKTPMVLTLITTESRRTLCLDLFHAIYDGISLPLLLNTIILLYRSNDHVDFGPKYHEVLPYGPLCHSAGAMHFWKTHLEAAEFPLISSLDSDTGKACSATLDITLDSLDQLRRDLGTTHQALIQASWMYVLQRHLKRPCCIGIVVSGRSIDFEEAEKTLGPLFNTVPFYLDTSRSSSWTELIQACHDFNFAALKHQHTALRDITKWCGRPRESPLFDTLFVFQREVEEPSPKLEELWTLKESEPQADYGLSFEAFQMMGLNEYSLTIVAQESTASKEMCGTLLSEIEHVLREMTTNPECRLPDGNSREKTISGASQSSSLPNRGKSQRLKHINGSVSRNIDDFSWSVEACQIRTQLAIMTGMDDSSIEPRSSIFELGLDSVDAIKLSSRLRKSGINLPVSTIMKKPTIQQMIEATEAPQKSVEANKTAAFKTLSHQLDEYVRHSKESSDIRQSDDIENIRPATPLQEAMIAEMIASDYENYFNHDVLRIDPTTDLGRLRSAWDLVLINSSILRTSFLEVQDPDIAVSYAQIVHQVHVNYWTSFETRADEELDTVLRKVRENAKTEAKRGTLFRVTSLNHRKVNYLVLSIAHALYDGWSLGLLHEDVMKAYNRKLESRPSNEMILERIHDASGDLAAKFWKEDLFGAQRSTFPRRIQGSSTIPRIHRLELESKTPWTQIESFCQSQGLTLQTLGQTCWALLLAVRLQQLDVVFGAVLSGRDTEEANHALFPTMNTVAVRSILHGSRKELFQSLQVHGASILEHQHFPLRKALALASSRGQLFDSLFIVQKRSLSTDVKGILYESIASSSNVEVRQSLFQARLD
jgi:amino acid adenylation domain-containing protein